MRPNPDRVTIHFTAPSLAWPEHDHFQYRLDGVDHEWIDAGDPRVATYTQLRPRSYEFRARARTGDDTLLAQDATLAFQVQPAWCQLLVLRIAALMVGLGLVVAALAERQRRRARIATAQLQAQFDARLAERSRIARELHDTLLQEFTGLVLHLEGWRRTIDRTLSDAAADELSSILVLADTTLFEARQSVWHIRTPDLATKGLARVLEATCSDLAAGDGIALTFSVVGSERRLSREIEATALHVAREAMRNIVAHARARCARVELRDDPAALRVCVSGDGVGMIGAGSEVAASNGHFGILGMRERAAVAGGTFELVTALGQGTRIELALPCSNSPSTVTDSVGRYQS